MTQPRSDAAGQGRDPVNDLIPGFRRQIVAHSLNEHQRCARDILLGVDPASHWHQWVSTAVDDQGGYLELIQAGSSIAMGHDLPPETWDQIVDGISALTGRV